MEAACICDCDRPDVRSFDDDLCCLSCGQTNSNAASHISLLKSTGDERCNQFTYRPLRSASSFRLVCLHAGRREDDITCHIFHSTLSDHPPFEALSYTWGEMAQSKEIISTEGIISITANCEAALKDLRYSFRDRILWIDALCINQDNIEEKNEQVPLMSRIYTAARRVVIYLGSDRREDLDRFFAYFRRSEPGACATDRVSQAAVSVFLSKPWFSRVWILQEVAVAKEAFLMWGTATLDWKYFSAAHLNTLQLTPVDRSGKTPPVLLFTEGDPKPLKDLVSLIHTARSCRSTEPRDKIYALLGLLDHVQHTLKPDYKKPIETIQYELVIDIIKSYNNLDILALANIETEKEALGAKKLAAQVGGMGSGVSFAQRRIEDAGKRVAYAEKRAEVGIANLLRAEKNERRVWARLHDLKTAWRQVEEAKEFWQEQHEKFEALRDVQMKLIEWGASMNLQETKWYWRKRKASVQSERLQKVRELAWKDSMAKVTTTCEKWSQLRKARWELAKTRAEGSWIELKTTETEERHKLETLEREWRELQEEERLFGVSVGIDIARQKYRQKYETWHELKAKADEKRSEIDQEEIKRQNHIKEETVKRRVFGESMLASSEILSQGKEALTVKGLETAFHDLRTTIGDSARKSLEDRECAQRRLNEERKSWSKASQSDIHDDPERPLLEAKQAWRDAKERMDEAKDDKFVAQFNEETRQYQMFRQELSSYYPEIQRMISKQLHSSVRFRGGQIRSNTGLRLPSWVPGLDDHQYLTSLACFRHQESEYPEPVARLCLQAHDHASPALEIRILELDTIRTGRIPEAGSMGIGGASPTGNFGRAFLNTNSLPDKALGTEEEDFLSRFQQNYRSEKRGSNFVHVQSFCQGRRRMLTDKSWAICSGQVKTSDIICIMYGASVPFVLRQRPGGQRFELMGECYLDGFLGPKFADDYWELLGKFRQHFEVQTSGDLPWKTVCLE